MNARVFLTVLGAMSVAACGSENQPESEVENALALAAPIEADIIGTDGIAIGSVEATEDPNGTTLRVTIESDLEEGLHGVHLHETGRCELPDFASAGGHWNPTSKSHGRENPLGAHVGDLANLSVGPSGSGSSVYLVSVLQNGIGPSMADADGTSLVVHAGPDDYSTDPSGNSGARVGCAVLLPPQE